MLFTLSRLSRSSSVFRTSCFANIIPLVRANTDPITEEMVDWHL